MLHAQDKQKVILANFYDEPSYFVVKYLHNRCFKWNKVSIFGNYIAIPFR